ncbi:MAG: SusC/RagA family TonB-linked outer membrane protein, partial [Saprospiraceae bacterium]
TKGSRSGKTQVDYNGFTGVETISNRLDVLSADEYRTATGADGKAYDRGGNTDWQKAITRTAFSQNHTISLSGGSEQLSFRGSLGYLKQEGVVLNNFKEAITARITANQKSFNDKLEIRYAINNSTINRNFLPDQSSTHQSHQGGSGIFDAALHNLPVLPVYNPDGSYFGYSDGIFGPSGGPVYDLKEVYSKQRENFFQSSAKADLAISPRFKIGMLGALSKGNDVFDYFRPGISEFNQKSVASKANYNKQITTGDFHVNYKITRDKHSIDMTGVYEFNQFVNDGFNAKARGFLVPDLLNNNLGAGTNLQIGDITSYKDEVVLKSVLGRLIYNYDDRYILTASFRRDGSSKFGPNHRWGNFPSVALAWRMSNEEFLKNLVWINNLKMRLSYGLTGNQENLAPYPYQYLYGPVAPAFIHGQIVQGYGVVQQGNPDLKWEVRQSLNIGVDLSIFRNRINSTIDLFFDKTGDMLFTYDLPQPPYLFNKVTANAANAINSGVELSVDAKIIRNDPFRWDASVNLATLRNRITNLSGKYNGANLYLTSDQQHYGFADGRGLGYAYITQLQKGYAAGVFWIPEHAGLDGQGRELFNNYDDKGKLTGTSTSYSDQDRVFIDPTPRFTWGITNNFTYKSFDGRFLIRGVQGQKIFANALMTLETKISLPFMNAGVKALTNGFTEQPQPSTYWVRDGSYTRLENLTIGYNFNGFKGIRNFRIYTTAINLFVLTSYEGIDPEVKAEGSQRYIDKNQYPKTRGITFGVQMGF